MNSRRFNPTMDILRNTQLNPTGDIECQESESLLDPTSDIVRCKQVNLTNDIECQESEFLLAPNPMSFVWFVTGVLLIPGCLLVLKNVIYECQMFRSVQLIFLLLMGAMVAIVDAPAKLQISFVRDIQENFVKYCAVVSRVTGKGLTLTFAGSALWSSLFTNVEDTAVLFLGGVFSLPALIVGIGTFGYGMMKSWHLHNARTMLNDADVQLDEHWDKVGRKDVIGKPGFSSLLNQSANGLHFDDEDLTLIFRALSKKGTPHIMTKSDMDNWLGDPTFTML